MHQATAEWYAFLEEALSIREPEGLWRKRLRHLHRDVIAEADAPVEELGPIIARVESVLAAA